MQQVPYKENRLVMFDSALFHKTDDFTFRRGYLNRRINLTLLFGRMVMGNGEAKAVKAAGDAQEVSHEPRENGDVCQGGSGVVGKDGFGGGGPGGGGSPKLVLRAYRP